MTQPTHPPEHTGHGHPAEPAPVHHSPLLPATHAAYSPAPPQRRVENLILNLVLYVAALLIIGAAAIFVTSLAPGAVRVLLLVLGTALFYGAGLLFYRCVPKLRLASYSFSTTGLALVPLVGLAIYRLIWPNGPAVWILTSLGGTLLVLLGLALMRERVMAYLLVSFLVSDVLSSSKFLQLSMIWYFVGLLILATVLGALNRFLPHRLDSKVHAGLIDASRLFVPLTMVASFFCAHRLHAGELALIFTLATTYCLVFFQKPYSLSLYLQARLYSLIALYYLAYVFAQDYWSFLPLMVVSLLLLGSAVLLGRIPRENLPFSGQKDSLITWYAGWFTTLLAVTSHQFSNSARGASQTTGAYPNFSWIIPTAQDGAVLLPAWILPLCLLLTIGLLLPQLSTAHFYTLLPLTTLPLAIIIAGQGEALLILASGLLLLFYSTQTKERVSAATAGILLVMLGASLALAHTVKMNMAEVLLGFAVTVAATFLYLTIIRSKQSPHQLGQSSPVALLGIIWTALGTVNLLLLIYLLYQSSLFYRLAPYEFTTALGIAIAGISLSCLGVFASIVVALKTGQQRISETLAIAFVLATFLPLVWVSLLSNALAIICLLALLIVVNLLFLVLLPQLSKVLYSVQLRILLLWGFITGLTTAEHSAGFISLCLLGLAFFVSFTSLLLYRSGKAQAELVVGLISGVLTFPLSLIALYTLDITGKHSYLPLASMLITALWFLLAPSRPSQILFSLLSPLALYICVVETAENLRLSGSLPLELALWASFLFVLLCKLISVRLPHTPDNHQGTIPWSTQPTHQIHQDRLSNMVSPHDPALVYPCLTVFSLLYLILNWYLSLPSALILLLLMFALFGLQSKPQHRATMWVIGVLITAVRILMEVEELSGFFMFFQMITLVLIAVATLRLIQTQKPSAQLALLWTAFALELLTSLAILPQVFGLYSIEKRVVLLGITVLLLIAVSVHRNTSLAIATALLLTVQVLWMSGGLSALTLLVLGLLLIGLVLWRLLVRKEETAPSHQSPQTAAGSFQYSQPWDPPAHAEISPYRSKK